MTWQSVPLGSVATVRGGAAFKPHLQGKKRGKYPFIKVSDMNLPGNGVLIRTANNWVDDDDLRELRATPHPTGATVFAKIGEALSQERRRRLVQPTVVDNNMMSAASSTERLDARFLFYLLSNIPLRELAVGTALPYLNLSTVASLEIPLPTIAEQQAIAGVLSALDHKLDLNYQMNQTLEAMAQALFKSWFVDFDPVRAKAEGRRPFGMDAKVAALFPHGVVDVNGRELPSGWCIRPLGDTAEYLSRGIGPAYIEEGGILVLNQKCVRGGLVDFSKGRRHDIARRTVEGRELRPGDVVVNSTGVGTLGRVAQVDYLPEPTVIVDSHITVVRANEQVLHPLLLGLDLGTREGEIEALGEGSTGQTELSRERLRALPVLVPPHPVQEAFVSAIGPMRQHVPLNERQSLTLATVRHLLLPKLFSGELRVKDA
jgi:type I restriction enzyme S subunit